MQLQNNSIEHIRKLNLEIQNIMSQIQQQSPNRSIIQSKIDRKYHQTQKNNNKKINLFNQPNSAHQKYKQQESGSKKFSITGIDKKQSATTIHFTSYMKSTGKVSERTIQQLRRQNQQKEIENQRQMQKLRIVKQKANRHYNQVKSRYTAYEDQRKMKQALEALHIKQKEAKEMEDLTFIPKTNKNIEIKETFEERLKDSSVRKEIKQAKIIKQMMKNDTFHPKINSHKLSQSKTKMCWSKINHVQTKQPFVSNQEQKIEENELKLGVNQFNFFLQKSI